MEQHEGPSANTLAYIVAAIAVIMFAIAVLNALVWDIPYVP